MRPQDGLGNAVAGRSLMSGCNGVNELGQGNLSREVRSHELEAMRLEPMRFCVIERIAIPHVSKTLLSRKKMW